MDPGRSVGVKLAGYLYGHYGNQAAFALCYLAERTECRKGRRWDGQIASLEATLDIDRYGAMDKLHDMLALTLPLQRNCCGRHTIHNTISGFRSSPSA